MGVLLESPSKTEIRDGKYLTREKVPATLSRSAPRPPPFRAIM